MTEAEVFALLKVRFPSDSHVLLPHVRDSTGTHGRRTADAIAFGLYPSRGLEVEGFEVKCSRGDWLREKNEPEKAESVFKYCDRWWLVVADDTIVKDGELPPTWGLLVVRGNKLVAKTLAPKLSPVALERGFIASLLRQLQKEVTPNIMVQSAVDDAHKRGIEYGKTLRGFDSEKAEQLQKSVDAFEAVSGVKIDRWNGERIGKAVKHIMNHGADRMVRELTRLRDSLSHSLKLAERDLAEVEKEFSEERGPEGPKS